MRAMRSPGEWGLIIPSVADGTRPATTTGTAVTPNQNDIANATYAQLISGAALTDDCYELEICVHTVGVASAARNGLVRIGLDPAGGTSYTKLVDLVVGPASPFIVASGLIAGGACFVFPIWIKNGTSIGAAASVNSATLTDIRVLCVARCRPEREVWAGTFIDEFGVDTSVSAGTALTPGTTSEGAWAQLGSALARPIRYLDFGYGVTNGTIQNGRLDVDIGIGDATNKKIAIPNAPVYNSANENLTKPPSGSYAYGATGDLIYARSQSSSTLETGHSAAAYGVG